ncbi:MAG: hypothetical protein FWD57_15500 [Polyangiaceae bacterium]|nr:hypothetical protein [Polyangiaceae bacterium]
MKRTPRGLRHVFSLAAQTGIALGMMSGCAEIGQKAPETTYSLVRTDERVMETPGVAATVELSGTSLYVHATHMCQRLSEKVYTRTTTVDSYNKNPWRTTGAIVGGLVLGAWGIAEMGRESVEVTCQGAECGGTDDQGNSTKGVALAFAGLGVGLVVAGVVDVVRANKTDTHKAEYTAPGRTVPSQCPQSQADYANARVVVKHGNQISLRVGTTDSNGFLEVDLDRVIPGNVVAEPSLHFVITVQDERVGMVPSKPLFAKREERVWRTLNRQKCERPTTARDCIPFVEFIAMFPKGSHVSEARQIITRGMPAIRVLREKEAWAKLDLNKCSTGRTGQTIADARNACSPLNAYLSEFPDGAHREAVSRALAAGNGRISHLDAEAAIVLAFGDAATNCGGKPGIANTLLFGSLPAGPRACEIAKPSNLAATQEQWKNAIAKCKAECKVINANFLAWESRAGQANSALINAVSTIRSAGNTSNNRAEQDRRKDQEDARKAQQNEQQVRACCTKHCAGCAASHWIAIGCMSTNSTSCIGDCMSGRVGWSCGGPP